jgi:uncharacterized membrane protein YcaP (DUF421 family)
MLGEVVDEILYGDVRFLQGTVATVTIAGLAWADGWLAYLSPRLERILEGKPTEVIRNGRFDLEAMRKERMNVHDVLGHLRGCGIVDVREVRLAVVENDGSLSVLRYFWAEPAQKADVVEEEQRARVQTLGRDTAPPPNQRTDSPLALGKDDSSFVERRRDTSA